MTESENFLDVTAIFQGPQSEATPDVQRANAGEGAVARRDTKTAEHLNCQVLLSALNSLKQAMELQRVQESIELRRLLDSAILFRTNFAQLAPHPSRRPSQRSCYGLLIRKKPTR